MFFFSDYLSKFEEQNHQSSPLRVNGCLGITVGPLPHNYCSIKLHGKGLPIPTVSNVQHYFFLHIQACHNADSPGYSYHLLMLYWNSWMKWNHHKKNQIQDHNGPKNESLRVKMYFAFLFKFRKSANHDLNPFVTTS